MFIPVILFYNEKFVKLKEFLGEYTDALYYSIHLRLLKYQIYFKFCEYIYKAAFIFFDVFAGTDGATWNPFKCCNSYSRRILQSLYCGMAKILLLIFVFIFVLAEIILTKGRMHLSLYILFVYPLIISFFTNFQKFGNTEFIFDVCVSDYRNQNFTNPRYPRKFWTYMQDPEEYFGFLYEMPSQLYDAMMKTLCLEMALLEASYIFWKQNTKNRCWGLRYVHDVKKETDSGTYYIPGYMKYTGEAKPWSFRLAVQYKKNYGVRWYHATRCLRYPSSSFSLPEKLHLSFISKCK